MSAVPARASAVTEGLGRVDVAAPLHAELAEMIRKQALCVPNISSVLLS